MQKLEFREAVKMLDSGFYLMHMHWLYQTQRHQISRDNTECTHFLAQSGTDWRSNATEIILVIGNEEAERQYMGSRAGEEKYGSDNNKWDEGLVSKVIIENQLLKKAIITYLHEMGSPLGGYRNSVPIIDYWITKGNKDEKTFKRIIRIGKSLIRGLDVMCKFSRIMWRVVDRRNPPDNDELRVIIDDLNKVLGESSDAAEAAGEYDREGE